jgi:hypothetical protein
VEVRPAPGEGAALHVNDVVVAACVGVATEPVDLAADNNDTRHDDVYYFGAADGATSSATAGRVGRSAVGHQVGRLMPATVAEVDAAYRFDWGRWPVPTMPDVLVEPWAGVPGSFWVDDISARPVDRARTAALPAFDVPIGASAGAAPWDGSSQGMPYQLVDGSGPLTAVWDLSQPITWNWFTPSFPITKMPLPDVVRREGDPLGGSDFHWTGYDPSRKVLWEVIALAKPPLARWQTWGQTDWVCGYNGGGPLARWDTSKPWNAPGQPRGVVGAGIPKFPLLCRFDQAARALASGDADADLGHAVFGTLPNYNPARTGPARSSDGTMPDHPVRAGERLRLPWHRAREYRAGTLDRVIANTLARRGWVQADKNSFSTVPKTGFGAFFLSMDARWAKGAGPIQPLGRLGLRLADLEVVT